MNTLQYAWIIWKKLEILMNDYLDKIINEFTEVIDRTASTPAADT